ncbi:hypothetical protein GCWU000342_00694 [Shuttleworthella satelles DSM 14600]|uniref:Uncharacterized protein n=1 Tax=Shuttleworthella satelles DSM 14600 TaxID=626523 RepID=C4G9P0_9FIRM|nr:hypothetical protein GCWU000342_00694 [Shuttleworthia satelles DSM 14600]
MAGNLFSSFISPLECPPFRKCFSLFRNHQPQSRQEEIQGNQRRGRKAYGFNCRHVIMFWIFQTMEMIQR